MSYATDHLELLDKLPYKSLPIIIFFFAGLTFFKLEPLQKGNTVDLLVLTSLDGLLMILQTSLQKLDNLIRSSNVLSLPLQLVFPAKSVLT